MSEPAAEHRTKRPRSPGYPGIPLREAIDRARLLYNAEGRSAAPIDAIYTHWGYSPGSGAGNVAISALKKFGLIDDEGSGKNRRARLSPLGLSIILDDREDSPEREEAIRRAALLPKIHRDIWERFDGELPSDATLRHFLRLDRGFTDPAADAAIRELRDTVAFANLNSSDIVSLGEATAVSGSARDVSAVAERRPPPAVDLAVGQQAITLPVSAGEWVTVHGAFPLSEASWAQMLRVLDAMKPGLVAESEPDDD